MPLTVLSDGDVRKILLGLTREDVLDIQQNLADALHHYSTATEDDGNGCGSSYQPMRTSLKRNDGQTTLFMPASSNEGIGVKIVTLAVPNSSPEKKSTASTTHSSHETSASASLSTRSALSSASASASTQKTTPKGTLQLLDQAGAPRGFMNAEEITAFRTALTSTIVFQKRRDVGALVVFGAGKQAYWHIRLALLLRGPEIQSLTVVNRSHDTARRMLDSLFNSEKEEEGAHPLHHPTTTILTPSTHDYARALEPAIRSSTCIFFTTPSLAPLFPAEYLASPEAQRKGRYLAAIGSYKPHMVEIHPDIVRQAVGPGPGPGRAGGAVLVDSVAACLKEAGEVIQAGLGAGELVELGEVVVLREDTDRWRRGGLGGDGSGGTGEGEGIGSGLDASGVELGFGKRRKGLEKTGGSGGGSTNEQSDESVETDKLDAGHVEWLQEGTVIFKCVGLGLMDVVVGADLVRLADERGVGVRIEHF